MKRKFVYQTNVGTTFANIVFSGNGKSYPQVELTINQMNFKNSRLESKNALGTWKAGMPGDIAYSPGQSLRPFQVISVFKIAVVVVSKTLFKSSTLFER